MRGLIALGLLLLALGLAGCAHDFVVIGLGVVHVDRSATSSGIRSVSLGLTLGCRQATLGVQRSYCVNLPDDNVAIIEARGRPALTVIPERTYHDEIIRTARDP